ncbi:MAG: hypothetical protein VR68_12105 [Peptococcaceae bacterium BRH_c4a]|nr:MAG: hypothetical protein VR68_12105 [Peptococcaceae bacterium BRH_c4a]
MSLILVLLITAADVHTLRVALGLPFVLFFPGYTLIAALFPGREDLDGIERVALSFGLSIAVVPLIGLLLNYTPWGIRLYPILFSLNLFVLAMSVLGWYRRKGLPEEKRLVIGINISLPQWTEMKKVDRALSVLLAASILFAVGTLAYVITTPKIGERFTEFYILGPGGKAEGYPRDLKAGQEGSVILGAVNHEYGPEEYRVEIKARDYTIGGLNPIALDHEGKFENPVKFMLLEPGQNIKVKFLLYRKGDCDPYRSLHLWVNVLP